MTKRDLKEKSDEGLMEMYKMGDPIAFEVLFERHSGSVFGFLKKRISKAKNAQDLLQEVFLKLHRSRHQYDRTLPFSPWLFSITRSVWLDCLKKKNLEHATEQDVIEDIMNPEQMTEAVTSEIDIEVLNQLPETQKQAVSLRVIDDATFDEIAHKLSTSPENARQLVSRGLKKLRDLLGPKKEE